MRELEGVTKILPTEENISSNPSPTMVALRTASTLEFAREVDAVHTRMARIVQAFVDVNARWIQLVVGRPVAPVANALVSTLKRKACQR